MGFILAVPAAPPAPPAVVDWSGLRVVWTGWDGSEWVLSDPSSGVQLGQGVRGFGMPEPVRYTSTSPALAGSRHRGMSYAEREVFLPVGVFCDAGSRAWLDYDAAFWATLHPERVGVLSVTQPAREGQSVGEIRTLTARCISDGALSLDRDPSYDGWAAYGITFIAEDPWWYGPSIVRTWTSAVSTPFLGGSGYGPPFYISPGGTLAGATMPNPGDVKAWPTWTLDGPTTSVTVGLDGHAVSYTATIADGAGIVIDTSPDQRTVLDLAGVDRLSGLVAADFRAIQPGAEVALSLAMTGSGTVTASLRPPYLRAW